MVITTSDSFSASAVMAQKKKPGLVVGRPSMEGSSWR
jgi:hypothetical protein